MSPAEHFSLSEPLPSGTVAIEASAGTGKTFTLASLALRYVAEAGLSIDQLLLVTFTRAAAADLRDRVRRRLSDALDALRSSAELPEGDEVLAIVAADDRDARAQRIEHALVNFDTATITTIHGFASQVLAGLGTTAPGNPDATMVENEDDLIRAACVDVITAAQLRGVLPDKLPSQRRLVELVKFVRNNPGIAVRPDLADIAGLDADSSDAELDNPVALRELLDAALEELLRRHELGGTRSYADVLTSFRDVLAADSALVQGLRQRYRVALIDEFQDTDPVQWSALSMLFQSDQTLALILVGDPKQSIYAFRGADVHTYLEAANSPGTARFTMGTNWRSDGAVIHSLEALFAGATFSGEDVEYVPVEAIEGHAALRVSDREGRALPGLRVRTATGGGLRTGPTITVEVAQNAIFADVAETIRAMLEEEQLPEASTPGAPRSMAASDIAVLVNANWEGASIQRELRRRGVPAVIVRGSSVLDSVATEQWRALLIALERPADPGRSRAAALTWFFGWSAKELANADDEKLADLQRMLFEWSTSLESGGVDEFFATLWFESGVSSRLLATGEGDRDLTDLQHLRALLRSNLGSHSQTAAGLLATLAQLEREAKSADTDDELYARQIESDALAVQIMTIHRAKGLEFPVVCIPSLYKQPWPNQNHRIVYFDEPSERRTLHLAGKSKKRGKRAEAESPEELSKREAIGEHLRKLYVATTRAEHQAIIWWAPTPSGRSSGLAHLLYARTAGVIDPSLFQALQVNVPKETGQELGALAALFSGVGDAAAIEELGPAPERPRRLSVGAVDAGGAELELPTLDRTLDRAIRRLSFSSITESAHAGAADPLDESLGDAGAADEFDDDEPVATLMPTGDLPLGDIAGGTVFGDLVHRILQQVDFAADELDAALVRLVTEAHKLTPWDVDDELLARGLKAAIETPLGPIASQLRLRDFGLRSHLNELNFELHFHTKGARPSVRDIGNLVGAHLGPGDPLRGWAEQLGAGLFDVDLAGHLTGSIDLVLRVPQSDGGRDRFVVADYKTNRLVRRDQPLTMEDYRPDRLVAPMTEHHYPLQALLYSVALHRYLRWRLPDYQPGSDLGGIAYLFVRGMVGEATPTADGLRYGVFPWRIPASLVEALSDLFERGPR